MKLDQQELEIICLSHLVKNPKALDKFNSRQMTDSVFVHIDSGDKVCYTNFLFKNILEYWKNSGGSLYTTLVLESFFLSKNIPEKHKMKLLNLWDEIQNTDVDENEFYEITSQLKNKHCFRLLTETFKESNDKLSGQNLEEAIKVLQDGITTINDELYEISNEKQNFDISQSSSFFEEEYNKRLYHPELFKGIECGISNIDEKTFGWLPGQIVVFLAPSSGGKSVMLLNCAMHANMVAKKKVLYMSFEMNSWLCLLRHVSLMFELPYADIKNTNLSSDEIKTIINGLKKSEDGSYFEYDVNMEDPTPEYIDSKIRDLIATKGKPDLLVVDYIGNMTVRNPQKGAKDYELQSKAVQELFKMAKRFGIPIITAQQINRETIRDARKAKESNKFMSYDQAAVSGGQVLMHLCTYAIAMEPDKDTKICILHPVKMRDAHFNPFPVVMVPEYNKIKELSKEEQEQIMGMHSAKTGTKVKTVSDTEDRPKPVELDDNDEYYEPVVMDGDEQLELVDWMLEL